MQQPQRLYETNLDFQTVEDEVLKNDRFEFKGDEKLLTFRLKEFPDNPLQLSGPSRLLWLHGTKPFRFLLDLRIARTLAKELKATYPDGISFKLHNETTSYND